VKVFVHVWSLYASRLRIKKYIYIKVMFHVEHGMRFVIDGLVGGGLDPSMRVILHPLSSVSHLRLHRVVERLLQVDSLVEQWRRGDRWCGRSFAEFVALRYLGLSYDFEFPGCPGASRPGRGGGHRGPGSGLRGMARAAVNLRPTEFCL